MTFCSSVWKLCLASRGRPWAGLRVYLRERNEYVMASGERSSSIRCDYGVPQGSVLGRFLFFVYVSPIADVITSHGVQFHQYADDTQLYIAAKYQSDIKTLEECTTAVRDWFTENGMLLIPDKSEVLLVARRSNAEKFAGGTGILRCRLPDRILGEA